MRHTMKKVSEYIGNESGAPAAEYAATLATDGAGIAAAAIFFGGAIGTAINQAGTCSSSNGATCKHSGNVLLTRTGCKIRAAL